MERDLPSTKSVIFGLLTSVLEGHYQSLIIRLLIHVRLFMKSRFSAAYPSLSSPTQQQETQKVTQFGCVVHTLTAYSFRILFTVWDIDTRDCTLDRATDGTSYRIRYVTCAVYRSALLCYNLDRPWSVTKRSNAKPVRENWQQQIDTQTAHCRRTRAEGVGKQMLRGIFDSRQKRAHQLNKAMVSILPENKGRGRWKANAEQKM